MVLNTINSGSSQATADPNLPLLSPGANPETRRRQFSTYDGERESPSWASVLKSFPCCCGAFTALAIGGIVYLCAVRVTPVVPDKSGVRVCGNTDQTPFLFWNGLREGASWFELLDVRSNETFSSECAEDYDYDVHVDWANHYGNQLFGNPKLMQDLDDVVREWNPSAHLKTGTLDECGWPDDPNGEPQFERRQTCMYEDFSAGFQNSRLKLAMVKSCCDYEPITFPNRSVWPALGAPKWSSNIGVEAMTVEYPAGSGHISKKNVLRLTSVNKDNDQCQNCFLGSETSSFCHLCHKVVSSSGVIQTADIFASGRYDVIAKVPANSGLVWAMWTFHQEEHIADGSCHDYKCYRDGFRGTTGIGPDKPWSDCCDERCCSASPEDRVKLKLNCSSFACECIPYGNHDEPKPRCYVDYMTVSCVGDDLCGRDGSFDQDPRVQHECHLRSGRDMQFLGNASIVSWKNQLNHEIDIEIPANCMGTTVCDATANDCPVLDSSGKEDFTWCNASARVGTGCIKRFDTANLNTYQWTTNGGTGPAYANMCVSARRKEKKKKAERLMMRKEGTVDDEGEPFQLIGDGNFHKYTIDWHTGGGDGSDEGAGGTKGAKDPRVDFYVDDVYLGSNNVFVPTRGSRLLLAHWPPNSKTDGTKQNPSWTNWADDWSGRTEGCTADDAFNGTPGCPGDGHSYLSHTYISEIKVMPHNEPNDVMYPMTYDQPDGCTANVGGGASMTCHRRWLSEDDPKVLSSIPPATRAPQDGQIADKACHF